MELLLAALDFIITHIQALKSFTGARRREYFEKILKPLVENVGTVHESYNDLLLSIWHDVNDIDASRQSKLTTAEPLSLGDQARLDAAKSRFLKQRQTREDVRDRLRQEAQQIFSAIDWLEERRLLASIIYYFLGAGGISPSDSMLDNAVAAVIEQGGISYYDTPATQLWGLIRESRDLAEIKRQIAEARDLLNVCHANTMRHYNQVHQLILTNTD